MKMLQHAGKAPRFALSLTHKTASKIKDPVDGPFLIDFSSMLRPFSHRFLM
jgi:hypothetical protein